MNMTKVVFWEINKGKRAVRQSDICFQPLNNLGWDGNNYVHRPMPEVIRYVSPIHKTLAAPMVKFYIEFLRSVFGDTFKWKAPRTGKRVIWEVATKDLSRHGVLTYLTAFRYVDELAPIIVKLYNSREKSIDQQFADFEAIHVDMVASDRAHNFGHALIYSGKTTGITIDQFRANLAAKLNSVNDHFKIPAAQKA